MRRFLKIRWILLLILLGFILALQIPGFAGDKKELIKEKASDAWITTKVRVALVNDKRIKSRYMDVSTSEGIVVLSGAVRSLEEKSLAMDIAASVKGVVEARDALLVYEKLGEACPHVHYSDQVSDALITTKVRTLLTVDKIENLKTLSVINVDTCNGVVVVVGTVRSEREKELAIKTVEEMKDVVKVVDLIVILPLEV